MYISIIIPVFNRSKLILRTLQSISGQSYVDFECLVIDDFSTDGIVQEFRKWGLDERFKLIKNKRSKGAQGARNTGITISKGEYICLFDSDNIMESNFLKEHVNNLQFEKSNIISICHSQFYNCDLTRAEQDASVMPSNWVKPNGRILENLLLENTYADFNEIVFPKSIFEYLPLLDESIVAFQELDFVLQSADIMEYKLIEKFLVRYVINQNDSISNSGKSSIGRMQILIKHKEKYIKSNLQTIYKVKTTFAIKALLMSFNYSFLVKILIRNPGLFSQLLGIVFDKIIRLINRRSL